MAAGVYNKNVFVNCPFDDQYKDIFRAIIFTVIDCGFEVRCALEIDDGSESRISKIEKLIEKSRYGIHDLSRTELDSENDLPRFNMPLELGLFLGAKRFGDSQQKRKTALVLDVKPYRYQKFISDIAGQDIKAHSNNYEKVIVLIRNWLNNQSKRKNIPGGKKIKSRYENFRTVLPALCNSLEFDPEYQLPFNDYTYAVSNWLKS